MSAYTIYHQEGQNVGPIDELLKEYKVEIKDRTIDGATFTRKEVAGIVDVLGAWAYDVADHSHVSWTDSHLSEESSDEEIIDFLTANPQAIKAPFVVHEDDGVLQRGVFCDFPERVFGFFG